MRNWIDLFETAITEIEQLNGDWSDGIEQRCARYLDDAEPFTQLGGLTVCKAIDRAITMLIFYDGDEIVGYAQLVEDDVADNAVEIEIAFKPAYQKRGLGLATYKLLMDEGYTVTSGYHQYPGAVAIWKKLIADPSVTVMATYPKDPDGRRPGNVLRRLKTPDEAWTTKNQYLRLVAKKR